MENKEAPSVPHYEQKIENKILSRAELGAQFSAQMKIAEMMGYRDLENWPEAYAAAFRDIVTEEPEYAGRIMVEGTDEEASVELFQEIIAKILKKVSDG